MYNINFDTQTNIISTIATTAYKEFTSPTWDSNSFIEENGLSLYGQVTGTLVNDDLITIWATSTATLTEQNVISTVTLDDGATWTEFGVTGGEVNRIYMVDTVGGLSPTIVSFSSDCACTVQLTSS